MTLSISHLKEYARKVKRSKVIEAPGGYKIDHEAKTATFVLESGPKLTMTEDEILSAIAAADQKKRIEDARDAAEAEAAAEPKKKAAAEPKKKAAAEPKKKAATEE